MQRPASVLAALAALLMMTFGSVSIAAEAMTVDDLAERTHFHGLAVNPTDLSPLLLATHHGVFAVTKDGAVRLVSKTKDDFMGFLAHPSDGVTLYASGHPAAGGNLGFMTSTDGGQSWAQLSPGASGIADFHNLAISPADPKTIYGAYGGLQVSRDGGRSWDMAGPEPEGLIDLAASARDPATLYAGTKFGLLRSTDGGQSWTPAHDTNNPVSLVAVTPTGKVFAYVVGTGLLEATEPDLAWRSKGSGLEGRVLVHLAPDLHDESRIYAVAVDPSTGRPTILASADAGETWTGLSSKAGQ